LTKQTLQLVIKWVSLIKLIYYRMIVNVFKQVSKAVVPCQNGISDPSRRHRSTTLLFISSM